MKKIILLMTLSITCSAVFAQNISDVSYQSILKKYQDSFLYLNKAVNERCDATGTESLAEYGSLYGWYSNGDTVVFNGPSGWSDAAKLNQGINTGIYFRDVNGNGKRDSYQNEIDDTVFEPVWSGKQVYSGETIISGTGVEVGDWGKQKGLFYYDADKDGEWNNEGLWVENYTFNGKVEMQAFQNKVTSLIPQFVNHTDSEGNWAGPGIEGNWNGSGSPIPNWTEETLLAHLGGEERLPVPETSESMNDWIVQQYAILNLLKWIQISMTPENKEYKYGSTYDEPSPADISTFASTYADALDKYNNCAWSTTFSGAGNPYSPLGYKYNTYNNYIDDDEDPGVYVASDYYISLNNVKGDLRWTHTASTISRSVDVYFHERIERYFIDSPSVWENTLTLHASETEGDLTTKEYPVLMYEEMTPLSLDPASEINNLDHDLEGATSGELCSILGRAVIKFSFSSIPAAPPEGGFEEANTVRDTNSDGLVDVGADISSFGSDTGTMNFQPERPDPQVYIPLAVNSWDRLPVHAYVVQGGYDNSGYDYWTHPDAEENGLYQAYSLHTRARINSVIIEDTANITATDTKRIEIIRPRGNIVVFEFEFDPSTSDFKTIGYPIGINTDRTYVLWDITPVTHTDLQFELHFDSGIIHHFAGLITDVSHIDGRFTDLPSTFPATGGTSGINIDWLNNAASSLRYDIAMEWKNGHINNLKYKTKDEVETIITEVEYDTAKEKVTKLTKSIPEFSAEIAGNSIEYGTGVSVEKSGDDITTTVPECGSVTVTTVFDSNELVDTVTITKGTDTAVTDYDYHTGTDRYDNGSPKWSKVSKITYPDNSYEEFVYATNTGWLTQHKTLFEDTLTGVTEYSYDNTASAGDAADSTLLTERPRKVETKIGTTVVGLDFYSHIAGNTTTIAPSIEHRKAVDTTAAWATASNLTTFTSYDTYGPDFQFTPTGDYYYSFSLNAGKTELTVSSTTPVNTGVSKTNVFGVNFYSSTTRDSLLIAETDSATDSFGRITQTDYIDGINEFFQVLTPYGPEVIVDREGLSTAYEYYANGRVKTLTTPDATVSYEYDGLGNTTKTTADPIKGSTTVTTDSYDAQGRMTSSTVTAGGESRTTGYTYAQGASVNTTTETYADNTTRIAQSYIDGRTKTVSGTAVSPQTYEYAVITANGNKENGISTKVYGTSSSQDWTINYTDIGGRNYLTETSGGYSKTTAYDSAGRTGTVTDSNGQNIVNTYNAKNELTSVNNNGNTTTYTYGYVTKGGKTAYKTTSSVVTDHGTINTENYSSIDGLDTWSVNRGRETHTSRVRHGGGKYTTTTTDSFGKTTEVSNETDKYTTTTKLNGVLLSTRKVNGDTTTTTDPRKGDTVKTRRPLTGQIKTSKTPDGKLITMEYVPSRDNPSNIRFADGSNLQPKVDSRGNVIKVEGTAPGNFDVAKTYDDQNRETDLDTTGAAGTAGTDFIYDPDFGTLMGKTIAGVSVYNITRHEDGRIKTKFRQLDTGSSVTKEPQYSPDAHKFYLGATYTDGTPNVTISGHDSVFGLPDTITTGMATYGLTYNIDLQLTAMNLTAGAVSAKNVGYTYTDLKRSAMNLGGTDDVTYGYDIHDRLTTVSGNGVSATYAYENDSSSLIKKITIGSFTRDFKWEGNANRIDEVSNKIDSDVIDSFDYSYDSGTGKIRKAATDKGTWYYSYGNRGQLKRATGPAGTFRYGTDSITNVLSGGKVRVNGSDEFTNTPNLFNNISARVVGNTVEVTGTAVEEATITGYTGTEPTEASTVKAARFDETHINETTGEPELRKTGFAFSLPAGNLVSATKIKLHVIGVKFDETIDHTDPDVIGGDEAGNVATGADIEVEVEYHLVRPKAEEAPRYDIAGRLVEDSVFNYSWDGEDRITSVESKILLTDDDKYVQVENSYDHAGRRIKKIVSHSDTGTAGTWSVAKTHAFYYDAVLLDGSPADFGVLTAETVTEGATTTEYAYLWGLDINGSYQGMGGVGGLLAVIDKTNSKIYIPSIDKQGSVYSYIDAATGNKVQEIAYDPYGRVISNTGSVDLPLKYCTKYYDKELGCYYYGKRFYDPSTCKWFSRDPLEEHGNQLNLYAFCKNDPINIIDVLGGDAVEAMLQETPEVLELRYTLYTLNLLRVHLLKTSTARAMVKKDGHRNLIGQWTLNLDAARAIGAEMGLIKAKLQAFATNAEYDIVTGVTGTSWFGQFQAASIVGVNGYGLRGINEAFNKDSIFAQSQTVRDRIFKGFFGVVELATIAIPVGRLGGQVLAKVSAKFPALKVLRVSMSAQVDKLRYMRLKNIHSTVTSQVDDAITAGNRQFFLDSGLSQKQTALILQNNATFRGTAIDVITKSRTNNAFLLKSLRKPGYFQYGPDFWNPVSGNAWDMTTQKQWLPHVNKYLIDPKAGYQWEKLSPLFH